MEKFNLTPKNKLRHVHYWQRVVIKEPEKYCNFAFEYRIGKWQNSKHLRNWVQKE